VFKIIKIDLVTSTSTALRQLCSDQILQSFTTLVAGEQTAGRGQTGTSWESEPYKNLTFSTIFFPENLPVKQHFLISMIFALSVKETLDKYTEDIFIKWPNDIYYRDKKISGMLIENEITGSSIESSIIGIGINVNQDEFGSKAPNPISLKQITGERYDLMDLLESVLTLAREKYMQLLSGGGNWIHAEYQNALYRKTGYYTYKDHNGCFKAKIKNVQKDGSLILETESGDERKYFFKEVSFVI